MSTDGDRSVCMWGIILMGKSMTPSGTKGRRGRCTGSKHWFAWERAYVPVGCKAVAPGSDAVNAWEDSRDVGERLVR